MSTATTTRGVWYVPAGDDLYIVQALQRDLEITRGQAEATVAYLRQHTNLGGCVSPDSGGPSINAQRARDLSVDARHDVMVAACVQERMDPADVRRRLGSPFTLIEDDAPLAGRAARPDDPALPYFPVTKMTEAGAPLFQLAMGGAVEAMRAERQRRLNRQAAAAQFAAEMQAAVVRFLEATEDAP